MTHKNTNTETTQKTLKFLVPSSLECLGYVVSAVIVLGLINISKLWQSWSGGVAVNPATSSPPWGDILSGVETIKTSPLLGDIFVILFWAALGSIIYMTIWFTQNSLIEIKREALDKHISGDLVRRNYFKSFLAHYAFFITLLIVTKALLYVVCFVILPAINSVFYASIINLGSFNIANIAWLAASVLSLAIVFHILRIVFQIYSRFWHMYIKAQ